MQEMTSRIGSYMRQFEEHEEWTKGEFRRVDGEMNDRVTKEEFNLRLT